MEEALRQLSSRVSTGELQTHDEIRHGFLDVIQNYLQEQLGLIAFVTMERDVGGGYYDARIGDLYFEIKRPSDGIQAGIDDAIEYIQNEADGIEFFTTEGQQGAHVTRSGVVEQGELADLAPRLITLVENAITTPTPRNIVDAFGPHSERVQTYIVLLWEIFQAHRHLERVESAFSAWKNIYAESANLSSSARRAVERQARDYGIDISGRDDSYAFLFVVQTYFALFLKLFAARLGGEYDSTEDRIERGAWPGSYRQLSIETEIIEHDLFDWFIDPAREAESASTQLEDLVMRLASSVDVIDPSQVDEDVLRELYQDSFDSSTRKAMGEFYTNDELVDEVLDDVGYGGEAILEDSTLLDPTCGSGTFLFHAIRRFVQAAENAGWNDAEIAQGVANNINGIDLHPFAVAMARTNYLLALNDRADHLDSVPVYWTDSLASAEQQTLSGERVTVATLGTIEVPNTDDIDHFRLFRAMERALEGSWSKNRFLEEFAERDRARYEVTLSNIYDFFTEEIHNGMWVPAFRDVAAVRELKEGCDYLVGNPPWVRRRNIDEDLRERLDQDFEFYSGTWRPNLSEVRTFIGSRDYSLAFLEAGLTYLKESCDLGLVITSNIIRSLYAGHARSTLLAETTITHIRDHSFSTRRLFPDTDNAPLVITLKKEEPPPDHAVDVAFTNRSDEVLRWEINPSFMSLIRDDPASPWLLLPPEVISAVRKMQDGNPFTGNLYSPSMGVKTAKNDQYFIDSVYPAENENEVVAEMESGETVRVEKELIRPLIRGRNVDAWDFDVENHILWTHDDDTGEPLDSLPDRADRYFEQHRSALENRADYNPSEPLWTIFRVSRKKLSSKVAWQDIAKTIEAVYLPESFQTHIGEGKLIPSSKVYFLPAEDNATQVTGLFNSTLVRAYMSGCVLRTGAAYCQYKSWNMGLIPVPDEIRNGSADQLDGIVEAFQSNPEDTGELQERLDQEIADLYGVTDEELEQAKEFHMFFVS